jgi:hypothetical protein
MIRETAAVMKIFKMSHHDIINNDHDFTGCIGLFRIEVS